jgi:hypothetical protein
MPPIARTGTQRPAQKPLSLGRLMEYSELFLARAVHSSLPEEAQLATRLLENVTLYSNWEQSHTRMMRDVAAIPKLPGQLLELRKVSFSTLHRKAPFEYLRERHVKGSARRLLIQRLFGTQHYGRTLVREHAAYISSACSYLCADSLCGEMLGDQAFSEALADYEMAYAEYYRAYCDSLLADGDTDEAAPLRALLPYLRYQLKVIRDHLLAGAPQKSDFTALKSLFAKSGDTQRLPVLNFNIAP